MALKVPLDVQLQAHGLDPVAEFPFAAPERDFRFDLAFPEAKLGVEVEGGLFGKGKPCPLCRRRPVAGHSSIERLLSDMEKYNLAALLSWRVVRVTPDDVASGAALSLVLRALGRE